MPVSIVVDHLSKSFANGSQATPVFRDLSFEVQRGEFFAIVGPNGAGKTTLLRILAGLDRADSGRVIIEEGAQPQERQGPLVRIMFQENDLFPWLTVRQNLMLGHKSAGLSTRDYQERMRHFLGEVGLEDRQDAYPHQLSGGGRQRVAIVRAFLSGAEVLLMDEPFSHLDPSSRLRLQQMIVRLWRETGRTIVFVTHDIHEACTLADRVLVMGNTGSSKIVGIPHDVDRDPWNASIFAPGSAAAAVVRALKECSEASEDDSPRIAVAPPRDRYRLVYLLSPLLLLTTWELASRHGWCDARFFPAPTDILVTLEEMAVSGELWGHVKASLVRLALGLLVGGGAGLVVGGLMAVNSLTRSIMEPLVGLTYPLPKIAILPLLLVIFGLGEASKVATLAIGAFFLLLLNTLHGAEEVQERYGETIRSLGLRGWDYYGRTLLKGTLPAILTGVRSAAGYCLVLLVAAEFTGSREGVGYLIWRSWELFYIEAMYAGLLVLAGGGFVLFLALHVLEARIPWRARTRDSGS